MLHYKKKKSLYFIFLTLMIIGPILTISATGLNTTSSTSFLPPPCPIIHWEVVPTGENHTIIIPLETNPTYEGNPLPADTRIGVFNTAGELWGFSTWTGTEDIAITVYGDDGDTLGFQVDEVFNYKIELPNGVISETIEVTYSEGFIFSSTNAYEHDGISGFDTFAASNGVNINPPSVAFSQVIEGTKVSFSNESTNAHSYDWTFGDGNAAMVEHPMHDYGAFGSYEICLTATNDCSSETLCQTITLVDGSGCNDVTNGGMIGDNQTVCPEHPDPAELTNIVSPSGGTGIMEYLWIYTTDHPNSPTAAWHIIHQSNQPTYDPPVLSQTTWYRRCVRTVGCSQFQKESNIIQITVADSCMDNFTCDDFQINAVSTPISCFGLADGQIDAHVIGGTPPYLLQWEHSAESGQELRYLTAGIYHLSVTDSNGCGTSTSSFITEPEELRFSEEQTATCGATELKVIPTGGTTPYELTWSHDIESHQSMRVTESGDYVLNIKDANNCQVQSRFAVNVTPMLDIKNSTTNATCETLGKATFEIQGGQAPYTYEWSQNNVDMQQLSEGDYTITILDSGLCRSEMNVRIDENCLRFTQFEVTLLDNGEVALDWEVMDEFSSGYYFIEQSKDQQQFSTKNVLNSKVNTANQAGSYRSIAQALTGTNFYRIRYMDETGLTTFSETTSLVYKPEGINEVMTYPNPFEGELMVDFLEPITEYKTLNIRSAYGQLLQQLEVKNGTIRIKLDLSAYQDGLYWIEYGNGKSVKVVKTQ